MTTKDFTEETPEAIVPKGYRFNPATFRPIDDMVLIRRDPPDTKVGKIELVNHLRHWTGTVVATGPGHRVGGVDKTHPKDKLACKACAERGAVIPMEVKSGDRVIVVHGTGHKMDDSDEYIEVSEGQILGVIGGAE